MGQLQRRRGLSLASEGCSDFARSHLAKGNMGATHCYLAHIGASHLGLLAQAIANDGCFQHPLDWAVVGRDRP